MITLATRRCSGMSMPGTPECAPPVRDPAALLILWATLALPNYPAGGLPLRKRGFAFRRAAGGS